QFPISYNPIWGYTGAVQGVIGSTSDADVFRLSVPTTNTYEITVTVPQFGNLDVRPVLYSVRASVFGASFIEQAFVSDPSISPAFPFTGLGATIKGQLPAGDWAIAVSSHGTYGDIGGYTLKVSIPSTSVVYNPGDIGV